LADQVSDIIQLAVSSVNLQLIAEPRVSTGNVALFRLTATSFSMSNPGESGLDFIPSESCEYAELDPFIEFDFVEDLVSLEDVNDDTSAQTDITSSTALPLTETPASASASASAGSIAPRRVRKKYGQGIDAKRTAVFRNYQPRQVFVLQLIHELFPVVTRQVLMELIVNALARFPLSMRPRQPTRAQKRVKAGLLAWIDENQSFMTWYLNSRPKSQ
jgi:hypothetical protein